MRQQFRVSALAGVFSAIVLVSMIQGEEPDRGPEHWIQQFEKEWNDTQWTQKLRRNAGYMRPLDGQGWKVRMRSLQGLVAAGQAAVPALLDQLESGSTYQRILAAQALGYLAHHVPREPLLQAAKNDKDPAVRLYAVDALGMQAASSTIDWQKLMRSESNRDVRKHIGYALERGDEPIDADIVKRLVEWDATRIDSAIVGKMAPDFELQSATGETVRLSEYRGRKAAVLVFIYGDT